MNRESITFEALFAGQLLGTLVFVVGLFLGGLTTVTVVGGALIMLCIVGLALTALTAERNDRSVGGNSHPDPAEPASH
ncbi:hypothetical protein [Natronorubrum sp. FCH18a]|uniref:hypothetical protein n=1 Tax=Natronorubrum sp. FCH18a TaxID=3447018 RepID=UPI003F5167E9